MNHLKILKVTALIIISILVVLFSVSLIIQDKVAEIIIRSLNRNFTTKLETGSYRLSLIRKFPRASVELKNILVHSSPGFNQTGFRGINTDTLLAARSASVDFKIADIFKGEYTFTRITIRDGNLNLFTDTGGNTNFNVSGTSSRKGNHDTSLNLNRLNLSDVRIVYNDLNANLVIDGVVKNGRIKSRLSGSNIEFDSDSEILLDLFQWRNFSIRQSIPANLKAGLNKNDKGVFFKQGILTIDKQDIILTGYIASDNYLDLKVTGDNIDISKITGVLPENLRKIASDYNPSGILKINSTFKGISSRTLNPHYEVSWSLKNARIGHGRSRLKIDDFSFEGSYTNGEKNRPETSVLEISTFKSTLGSAKYEGSFKMSDFTDPRATLYLKGRLLPGELKEYFNLRSISKTSGTIDLDINLSGKMIRKDKYRISDILGLDSRSELVFSSFCLKHADADIDLENLNGTITSTGNRSTAKDLNFIYNGQAISLSGEFQNLPEWIAGSPVSLIGSAILVADIIEPELITGKKEKSEEKGTVRAPVKFPDDVFLDLDFSIDAFSYKKFSARKIKGILSYKPGMLNFRSLILDSQEGSITGNALIIQNLNKSFMGRGSFNLDGIEINTAFNTFNNFGQSFLKAENLAGSLSGSVSLLIPADSMLNPDIKSITADGKYVITNGALLNFEPVKELSSFIELSELENISFDRMENDFFIRNNVLSIPQMEVRSSAVDLSVNGRHGFDNKYEYHVSLLLSEILSKKAGKNRSTSSEFGEIEDDGLGRTSMFLKITGSGEDVKVSYDMKAAGNQIKEDIKKERQTLKNILNEEYGRYNKTDTPSDKRTPSKPRFRISWEGSDTIKNETETSPAPKSGIIKRLLKKK